MKFTLPKMDKLLNDKNVLYVVFVVAILNLLGYLLVQNTEAVVFFLIVGFLSTYFSKNMIIVLIIAIVSTSIFSSTRSRFVQEGMSTKNTSNTKKPTETTPTKPSTDEDDNEDKEEADDEEPQSMNTGSSSIKKPNRIDNVTNLTEAYNNLQKTIGKGGIKALTGQTETLLNQQKNLMENIQGMQPFIKTAESFMSKLDLGGINGMLSKLKGN